MHTSVYRFAFSRGIDLAEAEATLHLAILAAEGLFGEARVRMEASYHMDAPRSALLIDGVTPVGDAVVCIFTSFLTRECGADGFKVRRVGQVRSDRLTGAAAPSGVAA